MALPQRLPHEPGSAQLGVHSLPAMLQPVRYVPVAPQPAALPDQPGMGSQMLGSLTVQAPVVTQAPIPVPY